jgi:hypothetical protein
MVCTILAKYFKKHACSDTAVPEELQRHLTDCKDCNSYYRLISALGVQKGSLLKAPEDLLISIEKKITGSVQSKNAESFSLFNLLLKPSFAVLCALLVAIVSIVFLPQKNIGYVENLSDRFKIAQYENIKSGDLLYAGDNTVAAVSLKNKNKLKIHQNTVVKVNNLRRLSLSRGEISLLSGDNELQIETPGGLLLARNANVKIRAVATLEKGTLKTETVCMVFNGKLTIKYPAKEIIIEHGQKIILAENGNIASQQQLTAAESALEKSSIGVQKVLTAVESLCDCIYTPDYAPGKKANHLQLFGKEVDENKFKVRIFWKEKGLKELVRGPVNGYNKLCSAKGWRLHV